MSKEPRETGAEGSDHREPTESEQETFGAVTWFQAIDSDQQSLKLGQFNRILEIAEPEETDQGVVYVRREFEPVQTISFQGELTRGEARSWIQANRDHQGFDGFDWRAHERRELLSEVVDTRSNYLRSMANIYDQLEAVPVVSVTADEALGEIMDGIAEVLNQTPPTIVDAAEDTDQPEQRDNSDGRPSGERADATQESNLQPDTRNPERRDG